MLHSRQPIGFDLESGKKKRLNLPEVLHVKILKTFVGIRGKFFFQILSLYLFFFFLKGDGRGGNRMLFVIKTINRKIIS